MSACKFQCLQTCKHANPLPSIAWYSLLLIWGNFDFTSHSESCSMLAQNVCAELRSILPLVCSYPEHQVVVSAKLFIIIITIISINCLMLVGCLQIRCLQLPDRDCFNWANFNFTSQWGSCSMLAQMCMQKHSAACLLLPGASGSGFCETHHHHHHHHQHQLFKWGMKLSVTNYLSDASVDYIRSRPMIRLTHLMRSSTFPEAPAAFNLLRVGGTVHWWGNFKWRSLMYHNMMW